MKKQQTQKILLLISFVFLIFNSTAQVLKFKVTSVSFKSYDEINQKWEDWTNVEEVDILGVMDVDNGRIKIYSDTEQTYDIIESKGTRTDSDGDDIFEWVCINEEALKCGVRLVTLNSQESRKQLYVDFSNFLFSGLEDYL